MRARSRTRPRRRTPTARSVADHVAERASQRRHDRDRLDAAREELLPRSAVFGTMTLGQLASDVLGIPAQYVALETARHLYRLVQRLASQGLVQLMPYATSHRILRPFERAEWEVTPAPTGAYTSGDANRSTRDLSATEAAVLLLPGGVRFEEPWLLDKVVTTIAERRNARAVLARLERRGLVRQHPVRDPGVTWIVAVTAAGHARVGGPMNREIRQSHLAHHLLTVEAALLLRGAGERVVSFTGDETLRSATRIGVSFAALRGRTTDPVVDGYVEYSALGERVGLEILTGKYSTEAIARKLDLLPPATIFLAATEEVARRARALTTRPIPVLDAALWPRTSAFAALAAPKSSRSTSDPPDDGTVGGIMSAIMPVKLGDAAAPPIVGDDAERPASSKTVTTAGAPSLRDRILRFLSWVGAATADQLAWEFAGRFGHRRETVAHALSDLVRQRLLTCRPLDRKLGRRSPGVYQATKAAAADVGGTAGDPRLSDRDVQLRVQFAEVLQTRARDGWRLIPREDAWPLLYRALPLHLNNSRRLGVAGGAVLPLPLLARPATNEREGEVRLVLTVSDRDTLRRHLRALPSELMSFRDIPIEVVALGYEDVRLLRRELRSLATQGYDGTGGMSGKAFEAIRIAEFPPVLSVLRRRTTRQMEDEERAELIADPAGWEPWHPAHLQPVRAILRRDQRQEELLTRLGRAPNAAPAARAAG